MKEYLFLLGRQPELSIAELESIFSATHIKPITTQWVMVSYDADIMSVLPRIGGTIKVVSIYKKNGNETDLNTLIQKRAEFVFDRKLTFGISYYDQKTKDKQVLAKALQLKKRLKETHHSVRIVPSKNARLSSAQIIHNKLTNPKYGFEAVLIHLRNQTVIGHTIYEQDIEEYTKKDRLRPHRDAKVGMLPPKLAQIIINLAAGDQTPSGDLMILDPFCGTGVILQEAYLMGFSVYGSDLSERMVEYSSNNMLWAQQEFIVTPNTTQQVITEIGNATIHHWNPIPHIVAGETYLGQPLSKLPEQSVLDPIMKFCNTLHLETLQNLHTQLPKNSTLCLAVPAWKKTNQHGFYHLKMLDHLEKIGYTRKKFVHVSNERLIYHREDQVVGREIVVLQKKEG